MTTGQRQTYTVNTRHELLIQLWFEYSTCGQIALMLICPYNRNETELNIGKTLLARHGDFVGWQVFKPHKGGDQ